MDAYAEFLDRRTHTESHGFEPHFLPAFLFDFQRALVEWAIRKGRAAIFADCGLGKTAMELVVADNWLRHTSGRVLILTPLAVAHQFLSEGEKFGIGVTHCRDGKVGGPGIYVTNYERLHLFDRNQFCGVICDESSILKNFDGTTKAACIDFMLKIPYRLLATATAAPNDYTELGNSAEALGEMGYADMLSKFFKQAGKADGKKFEYRGWGRPKYIMRGHAKEGFWRWVCSWARAARKPSDLGFDDSQFQLPELVMEEHVVSVPQLCTDRLFDPGPVGLHEERVEQRHSIRERCERAAELVAHPLPSVCWAHLNHEGDLLEKLIPGSVQISGRDSEDEKEEKLVGFANGHFTKLVTKAVIAGYGLNWQHCGHQTIFPSHSYEQWHQCIHRSLRFGRVDPVKLDIVTTESGLLVKEKLDDKRKRADEMFSELVRLMNDSLKIGRSKYGSKKVRVPRWLSNN